MAVTNSMTINYTRVFADLHLGYRVFPRCSLLLIGTLLVAACAEQSEPVVGQTQMQPPAIISQSRAIELPNLQATVTPEGGAAQPMTRQSDNTWSIRLNLPASTSQALTIDWSERYRGQLLPLATATTEINVGTEGMSVNLGDLNYLTQFDNDGDGKTNLAERNSSTDPYNAPIPGQPDVNVIIPRIDPDNAPSIDGQGVFYAANEVLLIGEWASAVQEDRLDETLYIENLMIDLNSDQNDGDPFHRWAAVHDGEWLYILVVSDDIGVHASDSSNPAEDDNLELYFDGDNSKNDNYGDADDRYMHLPLRELNSELPNNHLSADSRLIAGTGSAALPQTIEFSVGLGTGPLSIRNGARRQDVYEVRILIADLGIIIGRPFGIEVQLDDDDDGDSRDGKWGWFHRSRTTADTDETRENPSRMGTAILQ